MTIVRTVGLGAMAGLLWVGAIGPVRAEPTIATVACTLTDGRQFRLVNEGSAGEPRWVLSHRQRAAARERRLLLRGAAPTLEPGRATLNYKTANGGVMIRLDAGGTGGSRLDVYVSYELEVNVDASLTPEIDELNTDGERRAECQVE